MGAHKDLALTPASADDPEFTARVDADSTARVGDVLTLAVDLPKTHHFDDDSGENITR